MRLNSEHVWIPKQYLHHSIFVLNSRGEILGRNINEVKALQDTAGNFRGTSTIQYLVVGYRKMEYKSYLARVEFDAAAGLFHGEVINTRDIITFQGKSVEELKKAFADSVEDYLAFCAERGEEPDRPFSGRFTIRLAPEQHKKVVMAAEKSGKNVDSWVTDVLVQAAKV